MELSALHRKIVPRILGIAATAAFGLWVFIEVTEQVLKGETGGFDRTVLLALRMPGNPAQPLGPLWLDGVARDITALGSIPVLSLMVVIVALFLVLYRRFWTAICVLLSTASGIALAFLLKHVFGRARPDLFPHGDVVVSASFPSGHAMISALVYLTLGALVAGLSPSRTIRVYVMAMALLLTTIVGASRIYLGVHWPTDVLAGWAAGAVWALIWWGMVELVKIRSGGDK